MKKNEVIELNGVEYTLELNRESFLQIDQLCNITKSFNIMKQDLYKYRDEEELDDDFDISSLNVNEDELEAEAELKEKTMIKVFERAFLVWLNPHHHLKPSEVKEILKPYFEDEEKLGWLAEKYGQYLQECIEMRDKYNEEQKNLKALANK